MKKINLWGDHILSRFVRLWLMQMSKPGPRPHLTDYVSLGRRFKKRHARTHLPRDNCFDLCSEERRPSVLEVTGWHVTWIHANKRAEGKNIKGRFEAFTESFQNGTMASPRGEKSDPAGMFILDRKEAVIVITSGSLSLQHLESRLYLHSDSRWAEVSRPGRRLHVNISFFCELCGVEMKRVIFMNPFHW